MELRLDTVLSECQREPQRPFRVAWPDQLVRWADSVLVLGLEALLVRDGGSQRVPPAADFLAVVGAGFGLRMSAEMRLGTATRRESWTLPPRTMRVVPFDVVGDRA